MKVKDAIEQLSKYPDYYEILDGDGKDIEFLPSNTDYGVLRMANKLTGRIYSEEGDGPCWEDD